MSTVRVRDEAVEVGDGRLTLHVKVAGDGPPLLFFHPLPGLAWSPLLDRLAERHTVYAPEHPGTSPGDPQAIREVQTFWELLLAYEELIGALGLERPAALGQSFGGMVAADLAASFPRLFSRLVLLAPLGLWRDDVPIPLVEMVSGPPEKMPDYLYAHAGPVLPDDPAAVAQDTWNLGCTTKFAWPIADHGLRRRLHRIRVPALVLWGREDALVPVAYAEDFGRGIAGSQVEVIDDCGHVVQADQPELAWAAISGFLAEPRVVSVSREIAAGPDEIFELIADPARQPGWDGNDNLAVADAGQRVRRIGDVFTMLLTQGDVRENHVVEFEEGRRLAWRPSEVGKPPPGHLWRWELEPTGASRTRVTCTYDWTQLTDRGRFVVARATTADRLRASLDRLAALAEGPEEPSG
ncbi:MAG: alpha/beta fold hydrolase [Streptosporangiaceae bacterium]